MSLKKVSLIFLGFAVLQDEVGENIRKCERKTVTVMHDKVALICVLLKEKEIKKKTTRNQNLGQFEL